MSFVESYVQCDICNKDMKDNDEKKYKIEPRKTTFIRRYFYKDPFDSFWSDELDICAECWEKMKEWIRANRG